MIVARTADGLALAGDRAGTGARSVLFAHGGGQTRHAWAASARAVAARGWSVVTFDLRGHGESDRAPDGRYALDGFVDDVAAVAATLPEPPVLVGASLGGAAALLYAGERHGSARGLVLVDVGVRARREGIERIIGFMQRHVDGFASLADAASAVAAYAPRAGRTANIEGLHKNLRLDPDGRYRWHWDPALLEGFDPTQVARNGRVEAALRALTIPLTVVHGGRSDVLDTATAEETARLGRGTVTRVSDAAHMVAGDANDAFTDALLAFLERS